MKKIIALVISLVIVGGYFIINNQIENKILKSNEEKIVEIKLEKSFNIFEKKFEVTVIDSNKFYENISMTSPTFFKVLEKALKEKLTDLKFQVVLKRNLLENKSVKVVVTDFPKYVKENIKNDKDLQNVIAEVIKNKVLGINLNFKDNKIDYVALNKVDNFKACFTEKCTNWFEINIDDNKIEEKKSFIKNITIFEKNILTEKKYLEIDNYEKNKDMLKVDTFILSDSDIVIKDLKIDLLKQTDSSIDFNTQVSKVFVEIPNYLLLNLSTFDTKIQASGYKKKDFEDLFKNARTKNKESDKNISKIYNRIFNQGIKVNVDLNLVDLALNSQITKDLQINSLSGKVDLKIIDNYIALFKEEDNQTLENPLNFIESKMYLKMKEESMRQIINKYPGINIFVQKMGRFENGFFILESKINTN